MSFVGPGKLDLGHMWAEDRCKATGWLAEAHSWVTAESVHRLASSAVALVVQSIIRAASPAAPASLEANIECCHAARLLRTLIQDG